jgi:hypothetical protein
MAARQGTAQDTAARDAVSTTEQNVCRKNPEDSACIPDPPPTLSQACARGVKLSIHACHQWCTPWLNTMCRCPSRTRVPTAPIQVNDGSVCAGVSSINVL